MLAWSSMLGPVYLAIDRFIPRDVALLVDPKGTDSSRPYVRMCSNMGSIDFSGTCYCISQSTSSRCGTSPKLPRESSAPPDEYQAHTVEWEDTALSGGEPFFPASISMPGKTIQYPAKPKGPFPISPRSSLK